MQIYADLFTRPADVMGVQLCEHGLTGKANAGVTARPGRLYQFDPRWYSHHPQCGGAVARTGSMLGPKAEDDFGAVRYDEFPANRKRQCWLTRSETYGRAARRVNDLAAQKIHLWRS